MKTFARNVLRLLDVLLAPFTLLAVLWMKAIRFARMRRMPVSRKICMKLGIYPLRDPSAGNDISLPTRQHTFGPGDGDFLYSGCGVEVVAKKLEHVDLTLFESLQAGDILFIDSTHMIRPQGDVLCEFLQILPRVADGVLVHDIFTPRDYPADWIIRRMRFWNEQYLLEAFLSENRRFEIIGALNYLQHHHHEEFARSFPSVVEQPRRQACSFWFRATGDRGSR